MGEDRNLTLIIYAYPHTRPNNVVGNRKMTVI